MENLLITTVSEQIMKNFLKLQLLLLTGILIVAQVKCEAPFSLDHNLKELAESLAKLDESETELLNDWINRRVESLRSNQSELFRLIYDLVSIVEVKNIETRRRYLTIAEHILKDYKNMPADRDLENFTHQLYKEISERYIGCLKLFTRKEWRSLWYIVQGNPIEEFIEELLYIILKFEYRFREKSTDLFEAKHSHAFGPFHMITVEKTLELVAPRSRCDQNTTYDQFMFQSRNEPSYRFFLPEALLYSHLLIDNRKILSAIYKPDKCDIYADDDIDSLGEKVANILSKADNMNDDQINILAKRVKDAYYEPKLQT